MDQCQNFQCCAAREPKGKGAMSPLIDLFVNRKITWATSGNIDQCQNFKNELQKNQREIFSIVKFVNRQII